VVLFPARLSAVGNSADEPVPRYGGTP